MNEWLDLYYEEQDGELDRIVAENETWVRHYKSESKEYITCSGIQRTQHLPRSLVNWETHGNSLLGRGRDIINQLFR